MTTTLSDIRTLIKNVAGVVRVYSFLPPHGRELIVDEEFEIQGDIYDFLDTKQRRDAFERAITRGDLEVRRVPASTDATGPKSGLQTVQNLRDVAVADRSDKDTRLVEDIGTVYRFDATGVGADDGDLIITPTTGTGRWFKTALTVASDINNDSGVVGSTIKDALDTLDAAVGATPVTSGITNDSSVAGATAKDALETLDGDITGLAASAISNDSGVAGADVKAALDTLDGDISGLGSSAIANASGVAGATVTAALDQLDSDIGVLDRDLFNTIIGSPVSIGPVASGGGTGDGNIVIKVSGTAKALNIMRLKVTPTAAVSSYDIEIFRSDAFGGTSFYKAAAISLGLTPFEDFSFVVPDDDGTSELHVRITNDDGALSSSFGVEAEAVLSR